MSRAQLAEGGFDQEEPRSDLERTLARIWREVLGQETVGPHDNFFVIGGTSLHMIQLRHRLLSDLGLDVRITEFFKNPTVASLARSLSPARSSSPAGASEDAELDEVDEQVRKQREALQRQKSMARQRRGVE
jgi:aryl carrier-like protein